MTCLVDANVLCEASRPSPDPRVIEWLTRHERDLVVNPVVLGEVRFGILLLSFCHSCESRNPASLLLYFTLAPPSLRLGEASDIFNRGAG